MLDILMENYKDEMVEDLSDFIKIPTLRNKALPYKPYGSGVFDGLMFIHSLADKMDLECFNLFGHLVYVEYGDGDETIAILTHTDIVPPGEGWTLDPYGGEIIDGKIYGRGATDDKGPAIAAMYAVKALADNCIDLGKKVRVIFGGDEESGSSDIAYYKHKEKMPEYVFSPDGDYPIVNCEKGLLHVKLYGNYREQTDGVRILEMQSGTRINIVPNRAYCKLLADQEMVGKKLEEYKSTHDVEMNMKYFEEEDIILIESFGKNAHGSRPQDGKNAAAHMICFLNTLPLSDGTCESAVKKLAHIIGLGYFGEQLDLKTYDEKSGELTLNLGVVDYLNGNFSAQIDIRYPLNITSDAIIKRFNEYCYDTFAIHVLTSFPPHYVPEDSPFIEKLKEAYKEVTGQDAYCISIGGATYARAFKNGVTFGPVFPGKPMTAHEPDEYIEIDDLVKTSQIILTAIMKVCEL